MPSRYLFVRALLASIAVGHVAQAATCTYETWDWDTVQHRAVNQRKVIKDRSALDEAERGAVDGCSVCREDQAEIRLQGHRGVFVCRRFRDQLERALRMAMAEGFPLLTVVGYRVGRSKGVIDERGRRSQFSNHSYGVAVDVNSERNGLYDSCEHFGPACRLLRGGEYRSSAEGAITPSSALYRALKAEGFKWGGEIEGRQKDFMHFSITGT